jgi:hypothetical protein
MQRQCFLLSTEPRLACKGGREPGAPDLFRIMSALKILKRRERGEGPQSTQSEQYLFCGEWKSV